MPPGDRVNHVCPNRVVQFTGSTFVCFHLPGLERVIDSFTQQWETVRVSIENWNYCPDLSAIDKEEMWLVMRNDGF